MPQYCVDCKKLGYDHQSCRQNHKVSSSQRPESHTLKPHSKQAPLPNHPPSSIIIQTPLPQATVADGDSPFVHTNSPEKQNAEAGSGLRPATSVPPLLEDLQIIFADITAQIESHREETSRPTIEDRQQSPWMEENQRIRQIPPNSKLSCASVAHVIAAIAANAISAEENQISQSDQHISILNEEKSKSNSPSQQISPSSLEKEYSFLNVSSNNSGHKFNPEVPEFTSSPQPKILLL
ncbi:OLC1v1007933C1 [Oldenlandia corymbosa var. corymbosa]|uniref:OLC1v1007933C1 n=1 Tax=Oldenlandia corymbosa var. corymbosa TaxID=529605 RepID=A0AAV1DMV6_OLDCO|nr:OLC1v1007933C1 [Oldenlandia corymbosa var. corymbosa]